jgi:hypothetical protein
MRVNGQIVKATIDGVAVPISLALHRLNNGSAIPAALAPYQNLPGFRFESHGLGIFSASVPILAGYGLRTGDGPMAALAGDGKGIKNIFGIAGNNNLTVQRFWLVTDFSFSFGWQTKDSKYKSLSDAPKGSFQNQKDLEERVSKKLANKDAGISCEDALNKVLKQLGSTSTFRDLANNFFNNTNGYQLLQLTKSVNYIWSGETQKIYLGQKQKLIASVAPNAETSSDGKTIVFNAPEYSFPNSRANTFIHEILHVGGYDHSKIAEAMAEFSGIGKEYREFSKTNGLDKDNPNYGGKNTEIINSWISKYCSGNAGDWDLRLKEILGK